MFGWFGKFCSHSSSSPPSFLPCQDCGIGSWNSAPKVWKSCPCSGAQRSAGCAPSPAPAPAPAQGRLSSPRILRIFPDPRKPIQSPLTSPLAPPPHLCRNFPAENHPTLFFFLVSLFGFQDRPLDFLCSSVGLGFFFFTFHLLGELKITRISHFLLISSQQLCPHCSWRSPCVSRLLP